MTTNTLTQTVEERYIVKIAYNQHGVFEHIGDFTSEVEEYPSYDKLDAIIDAFERQGRYSWVEYHVIHELTTTKELPLDELQILNHSINKTRRIVRSAKRDITQTGRIADGITNPKREIEVLVG